MKDYSTLDKAEVFDSLEDKLIYIQKKGDSVLRNDLIKDYIPFILGIVSQTTGRYVETQSSEEFVIALEAFNESIDRYDSARGKFLSFASLVIKSRLKDFFRKEAKGISFVDIDQETIVVNDFRNEELAFEIEEFKNALKPFGINLEDLVDASPKHSRNTEELIELGDKISRNELIVARIYKSKKLPIKEISDIYQFSSKRIKTFKKFIISVIVMNNENLTQIRNFIK